MIMENKIGKIFNIQRFSVYDGPGIRTIVFFSGCNLKCLWCHNPESISNKQQIKFNSEQCIMCGKCFNICKNKAHGFTSTDNTRIFDRDKCELCLECTKECYAEALVPVYREINVAELEKSILTDLEYYKQSGGGVTFSGGEPMLQVDFLTEILKACKKHDIHTAVDTAGAVGFELFEKVLPYCDLFLYDIKAYKNDVHKKLTGISNKLILENLTKLSEIASDKNIKICVRIPAINGANTNEMTEIAEFLSGLNIDKCEFMPYHRLGEGKYKSLGIDNENIFTVPDDDFLSEIKSLFKEKNINILI